MKEENEIMNEQPTASYTDDNIRHLSDMEHVRTRPGMYIGRLGDGNLRSEERRVGKECRSRWSPYH